MPKSCAVTIWWRKKLGSLACAVSAVRWLICELSMKCHEKSTIGKIVHTSALSGGRQNHGHTKSEHTYSARPSVCAWKRARSIVLNATALLYVPRMFARTSLRICSPAPTATDQMSSTRVQCFCVACAGRHLMDVCSRISCGACARSGSLCATFV